ncbi:hypothetical protein OPQ81_002787 [Rhizoctonia solani]|nr:hypothetical protein OPQ81_002787 [Rhizoctonia solani]
MDSLVTSGSTAFPSAPISLSGPYDRYVITTQPARKAEMAVTSLVETRGNVANRLRGGGYTCSGWWEFIRKCGGGGSGGDHNEPLQPPASTKPQLTEQSVQNNQRSQQGVGDEGISPALSHTHSSETIEPEGVGDGDDPRPSSSILRQETEKPVQDDQPSEQVGIEDSDSPHSTSGIQNQATEKSMQNTEGERVGSDHSSQSPARSEKQDKEQEQFEETK